MAGEAAILSPLHSTARMDETGAIGAAAGRVASVSIAISNVGNDNGGELITRER